MDEQAQLSAHIRHLLLDYVRCHITTPYIQFTQLAVAELVSLEQVPPHDPASLTLPTDPFTTLSSLFKLGDLLPYQEKLTISQAARLLLKDVISLPKGKPRSERLSWSKDPWDEREDDAFYHVEPILTRRAVRETPIPGKTGGTRSSGMQKLDIKSYAGLMTSIPSGLEPVGVQPIQEPDIRLDQVLIESDVTYHLKASDHTAVRALLKSVSTTCRPQTLPPNADKNDYRRMYLPASFDFNRPRPITPPPESPPLVPIFARKPPLNHENERGKKVTGKGVPRPVLHAMEEIPGYIGASTSGMFLLGSDDDGLAGSSKSLSRANMVIVDGWQTYATSSPSTICSADDDDEIDELMNVFPSSPDTDISGALNFVGDVEDSKLEEVQIPRNKRIGGSLGQSKETMVDKALKVGGLGSFLTPLLGPLGPALKDVQTHDLHPLLHEKLTSIPTQAPNKVESRPKKDITQSLGWKVETQGVVRNQNQTETDVDSMCGQASVFSTIAHATKEEEEDHEIRGLYLDLSCPGELRLGPPLPRASIDPKALIRDERLFDDDDGVEGKRGEKDAKGPDKQELILRLMPVPLLPAPNTGRKPRVRGYREYLVESGAGTSGKGAPEPDEKNDNLPPPMRFLKGTKGIASLRVALSWTPFTRTNPIPAHARILGNDLFHEIDGGEAMERDVQALLAMCVDSDCDVRKQFRGCGFDDEWRWRGGSERPSVVEGNCEFSPEIAKCEIILTRAERRALSARGGGGLADEREEEEEGDDQDDLRYRRETRSEDEGFDEDSIQPLGNSKKATRARGARSPGVEEGRHRPAKRARLNIEDSGIALLDPDAQVESLLDFYSYENDMLDHLNTQAEDVNDVRYRILTDNDMLIAGPSQDDTQTDDKENDPPAGSIERTDFDFCYTNTFDDVRPGLLDPDMMVVKDSPRFGHSFEDYDDDPGGSFEPLSLSYDSQPYLAPSARCRQSHETRYAQLEERREMYPERQRDLYTAGGAEDPQDWSERPLVQEDIADPSDGQYISTMYTNCDNSETLAVEDQAEKRNSGGTRASFRNLDLDLARHTLGIELFAKLRDTKITPRLTPQSSSVPIKKAGEKHNFPSPEGNQQQEETEPRTTPLELYNRRTLRLPSPWTSSGTVHKYMASLDLLQKQVLVRSLAGQECLVELVERDSLDGVDLIIDPHTAVIFTSLLSLPAHNKKLLETLSAQTWRYKRVLVVFEAYPASRSWKSASRVQQKQGQASAEQTLYAYTPPIVKAIKRFRRDLDIAEGCGKKAVACEVWCGFADSVLEAAAFARMFGEEAERADCTDGAIWAAREWLDADVSEDEGNLASLGGMNRFSASIVLCQMALQQFLDLSPEQRIKTIGPFIGPEAISMLNIDIEQRVRTMVSFVLEMSQLDGVDAMEYSC